MKRKYSNIEFEEAVKSSFSIAGVLRKLGLTIAGGNHSTFKKLVVELKLDTSHFTGQGSNCGKNHKGGMIAKKLEEVMIENSNYSRQALKRRLIKNKLLKNICYECNILPIWRNKPMVLVLDHINGINNDNRLKNLRLLCPNCNSQTDTFCSRNKIKQKK